MMSPMSDSLEDVRSRIHTTRDSSADMTRERVNQIVAGYAWCDDADRNCRSEFYEDKRTGNILVKVPGASIFMIT